MMVRLQVNMIEGWCWYGEKYSQLGEQGVILGRMCFKEMFLQQYFLEVIGDLVYVDVEDWQFMLGKILKVK